MIKKYHSISGVVFHVSLTLGFLLLLSGAFLAFFLYQTYEKQEGEIFRAHVEQKAEELNQQLLNYKSLSRHLAANPDLIELVQNAGPDQIEAWSVSLSTMIPGLVGAAVFDPAYELIGDADTQQITEQCIEHVGHIGDKDQTFIKNDVHQEISSLSHFEFVVPIGKTRHWLLVSFSTDLLKPYLKTAAKTAAYYELSTPHRGMFLRQGENRGNTQVKVKIGNTDWSLLSRKTINPLAAAGEMPFILIAATVSVFVLFSLLLGWQLVRFFKDDVKQIINAIEIEDETATPKRIASNIYLREFYDLYLRISQMIEELGKSRLFIDEQSQVDNFTGLANERAFYQTQGKYFNMAKRQLPVTMVLLDVDDLGLINKTISRDAGDQVIKGISEILKASIRDSDESYHLAGGRFVVLMVDMEIADALKWYEFLTRRFEVLEKNIQQFKEKKLKLGMSAAAAMVSSQDENLEGTMARANEVLRSVKKQCKGIIVTAREPAPENKTSIPKIDRDNKDEVGEMLREEFHHPWQ